jgi:hypothetical protein
MRSIVAQIDLGFATIQGLMLPDGTYAISVPQIAKLFSLESSHAARDIKNLVKKSALFNPIPGQDQENQKKHTLVNHIPIKGPENQTKPSPSKGSSLSIKGPENQTKPSPSKGSSLSIKKEFFSANTKTDGTFDVVRQTQIEGQRQKINIVSLEDFSKVIYELQKKGDPVADAFLRALILEGIERRFDKAFGKFVEEEERNSRIQLRMKRILARTEWTDTLMNRSLKLYGVKPKAEDYRRWTVYVNKMLFNQLHFECNRDNMSEKEQRIIEAFETTASFKATRYPNATPDEIITMAVNVFL